MLIVLEGKIVRCQNGFSHVLVMIIFVPEKLLVVGVVSVFVFRLFKKKEWLNRILCDLKRKLFEKNNVSRTYDT
jgi:hypothetical protein